MRVDVNWEIFHAVFFNNGTVFVKEHEYSYEFYCADGVVMIHCIKKKSKNAEDNIMFVERYMTNKKNLINVLSFQGYKKTKTKLKAIEIKEEDDFVEKVEYKVEVKDGQE